MLGPLGSRWIPARGSTAARPRADRSGKLVSGRAERGYAVATAKGRLSEAVQTGVTIVRHAGANICGRGSTAGYRRDA